MRASWLFRIVVVITCGGVSSLCAAGEPSSAGLPRLKIGADHRHLVTEDGKPFFWLGDSAWWLRLIDPKDVDRYLAHRAGQRFNVVQVHCGYDVVDFAGRRPFLDDDTDRPAEPFWQTMDAIVAAAARHRFHIALTPLWGGEYGKAFGKDPGKAARLGRWIGKRYAAQTHVLWIVSGEYDSINGYRPITAEQMRLFNALGAALRETHGGTQLMTVHPGSARTSSKDFHAARWLDFNMLQSGHMIDNTTFGALENYELVARAWSLEPAKPVLDGEPIYEDTPDGIHARGNARGPRADDKAVRRKAYWAVLSGACGHTYGHNDIWGFYEPARPGEVEPFAPGQGSARRGSWKAALDAPGGRQMQYLRALVESRPIDGRIPDPGLVLGEPLRGLSHIAAIRAADGRFAMVYIPVGNAVGVDLSRISGRAARCWWFDPRTGVAHAGGQRATQGEATLHPPSPDDWVLVIDDESHNFPPPGLN